MKSPIASQRGFTLLEVLVATLVMAIAVAGLMSAISGSLRNAARLTDHDRAALLGRQKMDELLISSDSKKACHSREPGVPRSPAAWTWAGSRA